MLSLDKQKARAATSSSFILLQDQVIPEECGEYWDMYTSQKLRKFTSYVSIFKAAGLIIAKKSEIEKLYSKFWPVTVMALSPVSV